MCRQNVFASTGISRPRQFVLFVNEMHQKELLVNKLNLNCDKKILIYYAVNVFSRENIVSLCKKCVAFSNKKKIKVIKMNIEEK